MISKEVIFRKCLSCNFSAGLDFLHCPVACQAKLQTLQMNDLKVALLVSLEYKGSNVGILVGCYHATIDLRGSM